MDEKFFEDNPTEAVADKNQRTVLLLRVATLELQPRCQVNREVVYTRARATEEDCGVISKGHNSYFRDSCGQRISQPEVAIFICPCVEGVSAETVDGHYATRRSKSVGRPASQ